MQQGRTRLRSSAALLSLQRSTLHTTQVPSMVLHWKWRLKQPWRLSFRWDGCAAAAASAFRQLAGEAGQQPRDRCCALVQERGQLLQDAGLLEDIAWAAAASPRFAVTVAGGSLLGALLQAAESLAGASETKRQVSRMLRCGCTCHALLRAWSAT